MSELSDAVIHATEASLRGNIERIRNCTNQLDDSQIWWRPEESMNSIGNLVLHLAGNVRQWITVGFSDLEDDRDRPSEFSERGPIPREQLLSHLQAAVNDACHVLSGIDDEGLLKQRRIQGFEMDGVQTIFDCIPHFKGHTQEIICMTRMQIGEAYQYHWKPETPEQGA